MREEQEKLTQEAAAAQIELSGNEADHEHSPRKAGMSEDQNERVENENEEVIQSKHVEEVLEEPTPVEEQKPATEDTAEEKVEEDEATQQKGKREPRDNKRGGRGGRGGRGLKWQAKPRDGDESAAVQSE